MTLDGRLVRIAAAMASALTLAIASGAALAQSAASFIVAIGTVQVIDAAGQTRRGERGGALAPGDRVVTGTDGLAQVRFSDGAMLSIRASSELKIEAHSFRGEGDTLATTVLQLLRGGLRAITGAVARVNRSGYKVVTATATIGVRGTDFEAFYIPPGGTSPDEPGTYLRVSRGVAFLETPRGILDVQPQQVGFVPAAALAPRLLPQAPQFMLQPPRPSPAPKAQPPQRSQGGNVGPTVRQLEPNRTLTAPTLTSPTTSPTLSPELTSPTTISPTLTAPTTSPTLTSPTTSPTLTSPTMTSPTITSPTTSPSITSPSTVSPSMTAPATSPMLSPSMTSPTQPMTAPMPR